MVTHLSGLDQAVLLAYFAIITAIATLAGRGDHSVRGFLVGEKSIPWWAAMLSIIGTEVSALTFVGVPAYAYEVTHNFSYLMGAVGMVCARIVVGRAFVPAFYRYNVLSIYEFLELRFGRTTRTLAVIVFLFTRCAMSGVRLYAGSIIVGLALGVSWKVAIVVTAAVAALYTMLGGIRAVVWTEVLQVLVMVGGGLLAAVLLWESLPQGWTTITQYVGAYDKFQVIDPVFDLFDEKHEFSLWSALIGLSFFNLAVFGTDYDMAQRTLTAPDSARSARAVITSALADLPLSLLFLSIGVLLYVHYQVNPDPTLPTAPKEIFGHYILTRMPHGVCGLVVAGVLSVALSSFQSALNALSACFTVDIYQRYLRSEAPDAHYVTVTRWATIAFAGVLTAVAFASSGAKEVLILGLEIPSYTYPALLGVFLIGLFTQRGNDASCMLAVLLTLVFIPVVCHQGLHLAWTWNALFGTVFAAVVAACGTSKPAPAEGLALASVEKSA